MWGGSDDRFRFKAFQLLVYLPLFFKAFDLYVDEVFLLCENVPYRNQDFSGYGHLYPLTFLYIAEIGEESVSGY